MTIYYFGNMETVKNKHEVRSFAESIVYFFVEFNEYPKVFIYEEKIYLDSNSRTFGFSEILYNNPKCKIIFDKDEMLDCLEGLNLDMEYITDAEQKEIVNIVEERIKNNLDHFIE